MWTLPRPLAWPRAPDGWWKSPRLLKSCAIAVSSVLLALAGAGLWFAVISWRGIPGGEDVRRVNEMDQATILYDDHDQLAFTLFKEQRFEVPLEEMSPNVVRAVLAIEDQRFYDHRGVDIIRIASAALMDLRQRRAVQGASTITQQLARLSFLTPEKTFRRKAQEWILARRIERMFTKPQILELYLNKVYFGSGLYGVEAASRGYFNKHASELSLAQGALLAGLAKSPSNYTPLQNPERARLRQRVVLQAMFENGMIDRATLESAKAASLTLHDGLRAGAHGEYFKEEVRRELVERFGWQRVYRGGLRVFTTIDMPMQTAAESTVLESLAALDKKRKASADAPGSGPLQAALVALDPATGSVRAMVGGRDFRDSAFNRSTQAHRQPGSAFKPVVYAAALEAGFTPSTIIDHLDEPMSIDQADWTPEDEHLTTNSMTMRTALMTSSNRAAARTLQQVGIGPTVQYARRLGLGDMPGVPSLALGSGEVTLEDLTAAYGAFANDGRVARPQLIRRVEDGDGAVLYSAPEETSRAMSSTTAYLMATMLADVINQGTGAGARRLGFTLPAGGKTGTTNDFKDAWFVGFTPKLVAGVWVGFDRPRTILPNGFAADVAVPLWASFMKAATRGDRPAWLATPRGVTTAKTCRMSGRLATDACADVEVTGRDGRVERRSMVYTEYFVSGTEPTTFCEIHGHRSLWDRLFHRTD